MENILELQKRYENGEIEKRKLTKEEIEKLEKLYKKQIEEKEKTLKEYEEEILKYMKKLKNIKK